MENTIKLNPAKKTKSLNRNFLVRNMGLIASYAFLIIMAIVIIYPILLTIMSAFNVSNTLYSTSFFPQNFSFTENFKNLFNDTAYLSWYTNTFLLSIVTMFELQLSRGYKLGCLDRNVMAKG